MINRVLIALILAVSTVLLSLAHAVNNQGAQQQGDQFLDGIGETSLVARYVLNGNAEDSSRNQFHARAPRKRRDVRRGGTAEGPAADGRRQPPPASRECADGRGHDQRDRLAVPADRRHRARLRLRPRRVEPAVRRGDRAGFRAAIVQGGAVRGETTPKSVLENQWVHVAVVLDPARRGLAAYLDGAKAGEATGVAVNAAQIVNQAADAPNRLFIGRSQNDSEPTLHGRLRDLRIYRVALTDQQVSAIRTNGLPGRQTTGRRGAPPPVISTEDIPKDSPLASRLQHVPDITVETTVGMLPRLPATIPATYRDGRGLSDVRRGARRAGHLAVADRQQRGRRRPVRTRSPARCRARRSSRRRR